MSRAARSVLVVLAALAAPAPAALAAEELAVSAGRIQADAYQDRIVWSQFDPTTGEWELVQYRDGRTRLLKGAIASRTPLRVDVGPGPDGRPVVVYARGGDVFLYDFATRKERELVEFEAAGASESLPAIWRNTLVFSRRTAAGFDLWKGRMGTGRLEKLPEGPVNGVSGPIATEVMGSRIVFVWSSRRDGGEGTETGLYEVRGGQAVRRDRTVSGAMSTSTFITPEISGGRVHYGRVTRGSGTGNQFRRASFKTGRVEAVRAPATGMVTALFNAGSFLWSRVVESDEKTPGVRECGLRGEAPTSQSVCRLVRTAKVTGWTRVGRAR